MRQQRIEPEQKVLAGQHEQDAQVQHQQKCHGKGHAHDRAAHDAEAFAAVDLADDGGHGAESGRRARDHDQQRGKEHDLARVAGHVSQKVRYERLRLAREHERLNDAQHGGRIAQDEREQIVYADDGREQRHDHAVGELGRRARHAPGEKRVRHGHQNAGNAPVFQAAASSVGMQKPPSQERRRFWSKNVELLGIEDLEDAVERIFLRGRGSVRSRGSSRSRRRRSGRGRSRSSSLGSGRRGRVEAGSGGLRRSGGSLLGLRLARLVEAGGNDGHADLVVERGIEARTEDDVGVRVRSLLNEVCGRLDILQAHILRAGDVDEHAARTVDGRLHEGAGHGHAGGVLRLALAGGAADAHVGEAGVLHDAGDVRKVEVDKAGVLDEVGDAHDGLTQHVVRDLEGVGQRDLLVGGEFQAVIRDVPVPMLPDVVLSVPRSFQPKIVRVHGRLRPKEAYSCS